MSRNRLGYWDISELTNKDFKISIRVKLFHLSLFGGEKFGETCKDCANGETDKLWITAMQTASKNLMETLSDIYEKEWVGQDMLYVQAQNHEMLWADLAHKLSDQVVIPLNTYQAQFPEMRVRVLAGPRTSDWLEFDFRKRLTREEGSW